MDFHVISHTHWDREWHQTFQQYRVKLVRFMDDLIELLETSPSYTSFLLDGQTIVLEDYLEIKPRNRDRIEKLVKENRLIVGPWYIQPDEFIPSGESLVRNLLIGQQIANEFGSSMQIGYLPDSFGQAAQIPQVLSGFGIKNALFWRGITNEETEKTDFWWVSPDGSKVLATHIPFGYGNARMLSLNHEENVNIINENFEKLGEMATSPNILLMCGFDQRTANKDLPVIIEELNKHYQEQGQDFHIKLSRLSDYFEALLKEAENLESISGEFRKGKNMRVHVSINSTRLDLKKKNYKVQNLYEKYVEPLNSLSFVLGDSYDNDLINKGWKYSIQNHAHDSICNVCTDETHREMDMRYHFAEQIGQTVLSGVKNDLLRRIKYDKTKGLPLVIFNTLGQKRKNLVEATLNLKSEQFVVLDQNGNEVAYQIVDRKQENLNDKQIEIGVKNEDQFVYTTTIKFFTMVEGFGFATFYVKEKESVANTLSDIYQNGQFTNDFLEVAIQENGPLTLKDKRTGFHYRDLNIFEEGGNAGDEYDFSPPRNDVLCTTKHAIPKVTVIHNGPIFATVKIMYQMSFPDNTDVNGRSKNYQSSTIESFVTVNRYEDRVDIKTVIDNTVKNHRIRALFKTGIKTSTHIADQQFGTIRRENYFPQVEYWEKENWEEKYYPIFPQQKFVEVSDGEKGISILNKGLPQYEMVENDQPTIALTLLVGTDYMGKQDLVDRPGRRSGLHVGTPDSNLIGTQIMEYSIVPHPNNEIDSRISYKANEYTTPLLVVPVIQDSSSGTLAEEYTFIQLDDNGMAISALKKCEYDNSLIMRIYNTTNQPIAFSKVTLNREFFKKVRQVDLNEMEVEEDARVYIQENELELRDIRANEIYTFKLML